MIPETGLARLPRRILLFVHRGNFSAVNRLQDQLHDRKKEVTLTSGILFTNRRVRVNSLLGATSDQGPLHMSSVKGLAGLPGRILLFVHIGNFSVVDLDAIKETLPKWWDISLYYLRL